MSSNTTTLPLILGSSSQARQKVLHEMGYAFTTASPDIDEKAIRRDDPRELVLAIAQAKAEALKARLTTPAILITADQVVLIDGQVAEKPAHAAEARTFMRRYSGRTAQTVTCVIATNTATGAVAERVDVSTIHFSQIPKTVMDALIAEGECMYCCGALVAESPLLAPYIEHIDGDLESVMGFPPRLVAEAIAEARDSKSLHQ